MRAEIEAPSAIVECRLTLHRLTVDFACLMYFRQAEGFTPRRKKACQENRKNPIL